MNDPSPSLRVASLLFLAAISTRPALVEAAAALAAVRMEVGGGAYHLEVSVP